MKQIKLNIIALTIAMAISGIASADAKKAEKKPYPLTCVVSDEKLGSMGKTFVHEHEGREVQFCCKSCLKDFKKEPAKYLKKLDEAVKTPKQ